MEEARRSFIIVIAMLAIIALIAFARGAAHHRGGQQVGAMAPTAARPSTSLVDGGDG